VGLYHCPEEAVRVIYNGVNAEKLLGLSPEGRKLVQRLELLTADLVLLMPVRVTHAKNIEYALNVAAAMKAEGVKIKLILTGPPDPHDRNSMAYFQSLQKLRDDMGLEEEMRFVFESGPDSGEPYFISPDVVADLYRVADMMFMPSHQEGFGMPVVEAGLLGVPVAVANTVPAADEIGDGDVLRFTLEMPPSQLALMLLEKVELDDRLRLTRRTRQSFTWQTIFKRDIEPLLQGRSSP
jgi:glycosyltransferase involved in cell wall biosynthesis